MFSFVLLRAFLPVLDSSDGTTACTIWSNGNQASGYHPAITNALSRPADSSRKQLILGQVWRAPSSSTATYPPTINQPTQPISLCGLGGCATTQTINPFNFFVQVSEPYSLFSKKTSNYFLIQLPSPQCCVVISIECFHTIRSLLLQSGDIETNPGPDTNAILAELKKLSTGQSKLLAEVQDLKTQLLATDKAISDLSGRCARKPLSKSRPHAHRVGKCKNRDGSDGPFGLWPRGALRRCRKSFSTQQPHFLWHP
ncbi:unnamed protein product [Ixodes pacificus]